MHIIGLVLAAIGGAAFWYWRFKMTRELASDVVDAVGRVQGRYRTGKFRKQARGSVLTSIEDPALAAAVYLFSLANEDEPSLHLSEPAIRTQVSAVVAEADLEETLSYARWAAREITDPRDIVRRFKPMWREKLTREERADLVAMAEAVAGVRGEINNNQKLSLATLRMALGPEQSR